MRVIVVTAGTVWFLYAMLRGHERSGRQAGLQGVGLVITVVVVVGVAGFLLGVILSRRAPAYGWIFFMTGAAAGVALYVLTPERPGSALIFACVGFAGSVEPLLRAVPVAAVGSLGMTVSIFAQGRPASELWTIVGMLGMFTGIRAGQTREAARLTEQQNLILAERSRIAREIHDILAHSLSAQLVHLEGARLLMVSGRTEEALHRVERARGLARSGLEETRRALATLRGDIPPMDVALRELTDEHRLLADAACEVTIEGEPRDLPAKAGLAVIRTAQEALTNARKHAGKVAATVRVRYTDNQVEVAVVNAAGGQAASGDGSGHGLVGMRERVRVYGGELETGASAEGGYRVAARLPLDGAE
jgi:signal transduction histidine kinase